MELHTVPDKEQQQRQPDFYEIINFRFISDPDIYVYIIMEEGKQVNQHLPAR